MDKTVAECLPELLLTVRIGPCRVKKPHSSAVSPAKDPDSGLFFHSLDGKCPKTILGNNDTCFPETNISHKLPPIINLMIFLLQIIVCRLISDNGNSIKRSEEEHKGTVLSCLSPCFPVVITRNKGTDTKGPSPVMSQLKIFSRDDIFYNAETPNSVLINKGVSFHHNRSLAL